MENYETKLVNLMINDKPVIVKVYKDDLIGNHLEKRKYPYERRYLKKCLLYMREGSESIVIDCGANIGNHSMFWSEYVSKIIAIEGFPPTFELLKYNIENNGFTNIYPILAMLSSKSKEKFITKIHKKNMGSNMFVPNTKGGINSNTLDVVLNCSKCDFIKLDVEGFELKVLEGAKEILSKFKPFLAIELHEKENREKINQFLKFMGYQKDNYMFKGDI